MLRNAILATACLSLASATVSVMAADQSTARSTTNASPSANASQGANASANASSAPAPAIVAETQMTNADRDLAKRVVDALNQYEELRDSSITVSVRQGRVLLEGSVKSRLEADGAGRIANRFAGNGYVSNQLVVQGG